MCGPGPQIAFRDGVRGLFDIPGYHEAIGELFGRPLPFHNWSYPLIVLPLFWPLAQLPYFRGAGRLDARAVCAVRLGRAGRGRARSAGCRRCCCWP